MVYTTYGNNVTGASDNISTGSGASPLITSV